MIIARSSAVADSGGGIAGSGGGPPSNCLRIFLRKSPFPVENVYCTRALSAFTTSDGWADTMCSAIFKISGSVTEPL